MRITNKIFINIVIMLFFVASHSYADDLDHYNLLADEYYTYADDEGRDAWMAGYESHPDGKFVVYCTGALERWRNVVQKHMWGVREDGTFKPDHGTYRQCADFLYHMRKHFDCGNSYLCEPHSGTYPLNPDDYDGEFNEIGTTHLGISKPGTLSDGAGQCGLSGTVCAGGWESFTVESCPLTGSCGTPEDIEEEARQCDEPGSKECEKIEETVGEPSCPAGNPINLGTGNKYQVEKDFIDRKGRLSFSRNYNSQFSSVLSELSNGWTSLVHETIFDSTSKTLQVELKDGKRLRFKKEADGTFTALTNTIYTVVETVESNKISYVLTTPDNIQLVYNEPFGNAPSVLVKEIHADGYTKKYEYSQSSFYTLKNIKDSYDRKLTFTYTSSFSLLDKVVFPDGTSVQYTYNGSTAASQQLIKATYYNAVDSTTVEKEYVYGNSYNPHLLTGIIDEEGNRFATWTYDKYGRATFSSHGDGKEKIVVDYAQQSAGIITTTNSDGFETTYIFNDDGSIAHVINNTDGAQNCYTVDDSSMAYDSDGVLISVTESDVVLNAIKKIITINNPVKRSFKSNLRGLITEEVSPIDESLETPVNYQLTIVTEWHEDFNMAKERTYTTYGSGLYRTETTTVDDNGLITSFTVTVPYGSERTRLTTYVYTFFDASNPFQIETMEITDPRGNTTTKSYNEEGLLTKIENALGHTITYSNYNDFGLPGSIKNASGVETQYSYDPRGNMTEKKIIDTAEGGEDIVTSYSYYKNNILNTMTMPDADKVITYVYDAAQYLTSITETQSEGNHTMNYTNNAVNGVWDSIEILDENSNPTYSKSRTFDEKGRLIKVEGNNDQIQQTTIGAHDAIVETTNGDRDDISYQYDLAGKLISKTLVNNTTVYYEYTDTAELKTFTDANGVKTYFNYNHYGELTYISSVDRGVTTYIRDPNGNITNRKTYGKGNSVFSRIGLITTDIVFDEINRPIKVTVDSNATPNVVWSYKMDRLEKVVDKSGVTILEYSALGELVKKSFTPAGTSLTLVTQYSYVKGQLIATTYPSNNKYKYTYDYGNLVTIEQEVGSTTTAIADNIDYLPFTNTHSEITLATDITIETSHDMDGRITEISSTAFDVDYDHDKYNNVTSMTKDTTTVLDMTYDDSDQLLTQSGDVPIEIVYDDNGNRKNNSIEFEDDEFKHIYTLNENSNRIGSEYLSIDNGTEVKVKEYSYDVRGNIISQGDVFDKEGGYQTYIIYDGENQIESVKTDSVAQ